MSDDYASGSKVLSRSLQDDNFPIKWENDEEKNLMWWYDDLHVPKPVSPMYATFCPWWDTDATSSLSYMYRRFWAPFGKRWLGKIINGYVYTAVVPRDPQDAKLATSYYSSIIPFYADKFLKWWNDRLLPEVEGNLQYLDNYPYERASLKELLYVLEESLDIFDRHWRLHWILSLAQIQSFLQFKSVYKEIFGTIDEEEIGKILLSVDDKNWDSMEALWKLKNQIKQSVALRKIFQEPKDKPAERTLHRLKLSSRGKKFLRSLSEYTRVYGNKSLYTHELIYPTWKENPAAVIQVLKGFLEIDYDYPKDLRRVKETRDLAIKKIFAKLSVGAGKKRLKEALDLATKMAPLTPNHHFYFDQGTHARIRRIFLEVGDRLTKANIIDDREDIFLLTYDEMRALAVDCNAYDARKIVSNRKEEMKRQAELQPPDWVGTATQWATYEEPFKQNWGFPEKFERELGNVGVKEIRGIAASPGVSEGIARVVKSPEEIDLVQPGEIMVCQMTNPSWYSVFPKLKALVADAGGVLSHPAIISREFGIPSVVGAAVGTRLIKSGQTIRVDGDKGVVSILDQSTSRN
jgi:pyruvate,water dikinase